LYDFSKYQNFIQDEIKRRLNSDNVCYRSVQNLLSSRLLSKSVTIRICKNIILPVVMYGCETWSLTLREEHRLRMFENRVLRRIFGPKSDEMTVRWRKLRNGELHNLYSSPSISTRMTNSRRMKWAGPVVRMREKRNACRRLVGTPKGKRPLGRPRSRWVDNIKTDFREIGWG
jgi:hypothetical protein